MNILILYFSATGNTATVAGVIEKKLVGLGADVTKIDITPHSVMKRPIDFEPYQAVLFGAPIYALRAPRPVREWLKTLDGKGKKCGMFFTFGGFKVHPAHYSTRQILKEQNFTVVSSAEFLGKHTFNICGWDAMAGRPNKHDFEVVEKYAEATYKRFTGEDEGILSELEKTEHTEEQLDISDDSRSKTINPPSRNGENCSMCLVCGKVCPTRAMNASLGEADREKCVACMACVVNCPDKALKMNDMSHVWLHMLKAENTTKEEQQKQKSKIYL